jgi:hypothetical protein
MTSANGAEKKAGVLSGKASADPRHPILSMP